MIKITVVVPTYRPGARIQRVVRSLDAQTLPKHEFEVLYIDDGSGEETLSLLDEIAAERANSRVHALPHSGWPSAARNAGIERARGEYVLFLDHDDELFPEALRAAYELGRRNSADVVSGKEIRTDQADWGLSAFTADIDNAIGRTPHPLLPMNPHKLYRVALLRDHGIRFPTADDGIGRVMWEDIVFNTRVAHHAGVVSVLSSVPFYHWIAAGESSSTGFVRSNPEYWDALADVFQTIDDELADAPLQRRQLIMHQYGHRVLKSFLRRWKRRGADERELIIARSRELIERFVPAEYDDDLTRRQHAVATLLRTGRVRELDGLCLNDDGVAPVTRAESVVWEDGRLRVGVRTRWNDAHGDGIRMRRAGGRVIRDLPGAVAEAVGESDRDLTTALSDARTTLAVRSRTDKTVWLVETASTPASPAELEERDGTLIPETAAVATIDHGTAALGAPLDHGVWTVTARAGFDGWSAHRSVVSDLPPAVCLADGVAAVAYSTKDGKLAVDYGQSTRSVINSSDPDPENAVTKKYGSVITFSIPLEGVAVHGRTVITGDVLLARVARATARERGARGLVTELPRVGRLFRRGPGIHAARLVGDGERAFVEGGVDIVPGEFALAFRFPDRLVTTRIHVEISRDRRYRFFVVD